MNAIALDPSLRGFGVYSVRDGQESSEVKRISSDIGRMDTLGKLFSWLSRLSAPEKGWGLCIVEGYSLGSKSSAVTVQAEVGGIARGWFSARDIPVIEVPPQVWKAVTGVRLKKGTAMHKSDYLNAVRTLYGRDFGTTDECDAFLIYQCVKKCGIERPVGPGAVKIRQQLEEFKINAREM